MASLGMELGFSFQRGEPFSVLVPGEDVLVAAAGAAASLCRGEPRGTPAASCNLQVSLPSPHIASSTRPQSRFT